MPNEDLTQDEKEFLAAYRKVRGMGFGDMTIAFEDGALAKLWITEKRNPRTLRQMTRLKEGE